MKIRDQSNNYEKEYFFEYNLNVRKLNAINILKNKLNIK